MKFALTLLAVALFAGDVTAQTAPINRVPVLQPSPGERVRVNYGAEGSTVVQGTWVAMDPYGVRLLAAPQDTVHVALDRLVSLERSTGTQRHTGIGVVLGSILGLFVGLAVAPEDEATSSCGVPDYSKLAGAAVGGLVGGVVGALIGASIKTDRWETLPLRPAGQ